jgi:hypothetical protein
MLKDWLRLLALQAIGMCFSLCAANYSALAQPSTDIPEETLQVSITERAHSQIDGRIQASREQAFEQAHLRVAPEDVPARLAPQVQRVVVLLRIRKLLKSLIPVF